MRHYEVKGNMTNTGPEKHQPNNEEDLQVVLSPWMCGSRPRRSRHRHYQSPGNTTRLCHPPFYTQELADLIHTAKRAEIPSGHLSFLEKPVDLASAMLTFLLEKRSQ